MSGSPEPVFVAAEARNPCGLRHWLRESRPGLDRGSCLGPPGGWLFTIRSYPARHPSLDFGAGGASPVDPTEEGATEAVPPWQKLVVGLTDHRDRLGGRVSRRRA